MSDQNSLVVHSNALSRARWTIESVWEPRLVALLANKIHSNDEDLKKYEIPISELFQSKTYGKEQYREVEKTIDKVMSRVITMRNDTGWKKYNVFLYCEFNNKTNMLTLGVHPDLKSHYLHLQNQFVKYSLTEFLQLPSIYSQRLYQFLKSWDDKPETPNISIDDLHELLNVSESAKKNYAELKRYVLDKAYKDIHKITKLQFEFEPIKTGRKVTAVRFVFAKKRALPVATRKKEAKQEKTSKENNKKFLEAVECWKGKGGQTCLGGLRSKAICDYCTKIIQARA